MHYYYLGGVSILVAFITTLFLTKKWISIAKGMGLTGKDINKEDEPEVAESGGITVIIGLTFAILFFIFSLTFLIGTEAYLLHTFALFSGILLAGLLGFTDDILSWKGGLRKWQKPLLTIPIALPLVVINAGTSSMTFPFIGSVELGLLYPLIIIPIGIVGAANGFNMLAGYNGLEAGQGSIILFTLGLMAYLTGNLWLGLVCFAMTASLIAFLVYNKYPAKVFPGDSLTYATGALIAMVAIFGNMQRAAVLLFIPYIVEFFLKLRGRFPTSWKKWGGELTEEGKLKPVGDKIVTIPQAVMKLHGSASERRVVWETWLIQITVAVFVLARFFWL